jgi:hypothetical protein
VVKLISLGDVRHPRDIAVGLMTVSLQEPTLHAPAPKVVLGEIHHRPVQIGAQRLRIADQADPSQQSHEAVVDDVFGARPVAGQEEGEPDGLDSVVAVKVIDLPLHPAHPHARCSPAEPRIRLPHTL